MRSVLLTGIKKFEIKNIPLPEIKEENEVLIRIKTVGICGSDIHYYTAGRIGSQVVDYPFTIGHEAAGIVEKVGKSVTKVKEGQRVAIDPAVSCGVCDQCKAGRENTCRKLLFLGCPKQLSGCLCEYIVMKENSCFPISDSMTYEQATLSEPLAIGVYAVERGMLKDKMNAAILGAGPIGMSVLLVLRTMNIGNVYVTDKLNYRLGFSKKLNPAWVGNPDQMDVVQEISDHDPLLMDVVFECSGDPNAIKQGIELLKPGGNLVIVGIPEVDEISFPIHELRRKEITIINVRRQAHCTQKAIDLLQSGKINMDFMATHSFTMNEIEKAFELVSGYKDNVMKAFIIIE
ncbi:MAG: hypothetical protein C4539_18205 [Ignavibacteriales bacterium]|nr:MAG: hypothetical protein C4539_18205 [Ignavibacteriales bacterium]